MLHKTVILTTVEKGRLLHFNHLRCTNTILQIFYESAKKWLPGGKLYGGTNCMSMPFIQKNSFLQTCKMLLYPSQKNNHGHRFDGLAGGVRHTEYHIETEQCFRPDSRRPGACLSPVDFEKFCWRRLKPSLLPAAILLGQSLLMVIGAMTAWLPSHSTRSRPFQLLSQLQLQCLGDGFRVISLTYLSFRACAQVRQ